MTPMTANSDPHPLVCRFGAFGDMVMITPLLQHLYHRSGLACDVIGIGGWNHALFRNMPWVRNVYTIDSRAAPYWFNRSQQTLVSTLRTQGERCAWICETDSRSYRLLARAGIAGGSCIRETDLPKIGPEHYCDRWLRLAQLTPTRCDFPAVSIESPNPTLFVTAGETDECRRWLQQRGIDPETPLVCMQAGNKRTMRRGRADRASNTKYWHERNWAAVADGIVERDAKTQILLCGVPSEQDMCEAIVATSQSRQNLHAVADDLPLRRLLALLSIAHSCVSVDTGPAHAAAALNCPVVVLFGKANPIRFRPVSNESPVRVLVGAPPDGQGGENDIGRIDPRSVLDAWEQLSHS